MPGVLGVPGGLRFFWRRVREVFLTTVENMDVFAGACRDVFTAFVKRPPGYGALQKADLPV
jgi:hypothetical protein